MKDWDQKSPGTDNSLKEGTKPRDVYLKFKKTELQNPDWQPSPKKINKEEKKKWETARDLATPNEGRGLKVTAHVGASTLCERSHDVAAITVNTAYFLSGPTTSPRLQDPGSGSLVSGP